jgi:hypothetical protein
MPLGLQDLLCTENVESLELVQSGGVGSDSGLNRCSTSFPFLDDAKEVLVRSIETESDNLNQSEYTSRLHSHSFEFLSRANSMSWILKVYFLFWGLIAYCWFVSINFYVLK